MITVKAFSIRFLVNFFEFFVFYMVPKPWLGNPVISEDLLHTKLEFCRKLRSRQMIVLILKVGSQLPILF